MFIDWLTISQEHDHDLPVVCDVFTLTIDANTNEVLSTRQPRFKHEASFSTSVSIHVQGRKIRVEGNPSRVGRLDNLFGFTSIEQCVSVYNALYANTASRASVAALALIFVRVSQAQNPGTVSPMGQRLNGLT
ncbi:phage/plasmid replication domain-containing protein [Pseudomonas trivialis]|uniref:Replication-associated protein G2P N-terminal domain-containing protein n=1 Tax=Pseudomonas trivialis TaxID=200450 RepID=A0A0H5AFQ2_9PSED|nr:phage/plasmid replication protein [Pseudomonas trivialis]AKS10059.1 hypothetical protein AA957_29430 [Pseudomonas trivialis]